MAKAAVANQATKKAAHVPYTLAEARLHAITKMPYMSAHVMSLVPVEKPGLDTFAVDSKMRMYFDPVMLERWTLSECSAVILHEDMHCLLRHHKRCKALLGETLTQEQQIRSNIAMDMCINEILREAKVVLPDGCVYPETYSLPENLPWEEYYRLLDEKNLLNFQYVSVSDYFDGDGNLKMPGIGGGSCADGQERSYEDGKGTGKGDGEEATSGGGKGQGSGQVVAGISEHEQELLSREIAKKIEERNQASTSRGTIPAGLLREADTILRPNVDPWRELLALVRYAVTATRGFGDYTYRRLPRRDIGGGFRMPAHFKPVPRVLVLVDTSGSMGEKDLALGLGVIDQATRHLPPEMINVASADTEVHLVQKCVGSARKVQLLGGGGTDVGYAMEQAAKLRPAPDVIVAITDSMTPWPEHELKQRCVALLTQEHRQWPVPAWIKKVVLQTEES